ncbi:hypothetical protein GCM10007860_00400 [Chitiniphilus shinanonensis]|uniref:Uncharacterized protein n=1 Tax=Chitiniphilus shinanonensis TaxID=553088 RepID=A0ABQ6BNP9_9NEIS|nr:hypothetical protein GCM10007860_00400 [Chitiniphilus shinanonensis]
MHQPGAQQADAQHGDKHGGAVAEQVLDEATHGDARSNAGVPAGTNHYARAHAAVPHPAGGPTGGPTLGNDAKDMPGAAVPGEWDESESDDRKSGRGHRDVVRHKKLPAGCSTPVRGASNTISSRPDTGMMQSSGHPTPR